MRLHEHHVFGFKAKQEAYSLPILFWLKVVCRLKLSLSIGFTTLQHYSVWLLCLTEGEGLGKGSSLAIPCAAWCAAFLPVLRQVSHKLERHPAGCA